MVKKPSVFPALVWILAAIVSGLVIWQQSRIISSQQELLAYQCERMEILSALLVGCERRSSLQPEHRGRVLAPLPALAHVPVERGARPVPCHSHDHAIGGTGGRGLGREPRAQRVAAVAPRVEPDRLDGAFDELVDGATREPVSAETIVSIDRAKHRARRDLAAPEPRAQRGDRARLRARRSGDRLDASLPLLVGLRSPDVDPDAVANELEVLDVERHELATPEPAGEPHQEDGAIARGRVRVGHLREDQPEVVGHQGRLPVLGRAVRAADPGRDGAHRGVAERRLGTRRAMHPVDRGEASAQRRGLEVSGLVSEVERERLGRDGEGADVSRGAPGGKRAHVGVVGATARGRVGRAGVVLGATGELVELLELAGGVGDEGVVFGQRSCLSVEVGTSPDGPATHIEHTTLTRSTVTSTVDVLVRMPADRLVASQISLGVRMPGVPCHDEFSFVYADGSRHAYVYRRPDPDRAATGGADFVSYVERGDVRTVELYEFRPDPVCPWCLSSSFTVFMRSESPGPGVRTGYECRSCRRQFAVVWPSVERYAELGNYVGKRGA